MKAKKLLSIGLLLGFQSFASLFSASASTTFTFDNISSLDQYASSGVTFSSNAGIWYSSSVSVLVDPSGGPYSTPNALMFGNCGGVLGTIFFSSPQREVSIWALSGPGPDLLSNGTWIKAYDANGNFLASDTVNSSLQFDLLSVLSSGISGISRLDVYSPRLDGYFPIVGTEVWDDLTITPVPIPSAFWLLGSSLAGLAGLKSRRKQK